MTRIEELRDLYAYNRWANDRLLDATARLSAEDLARPIVSSFPSVLGTLVHVAESDWVWLRRWQGESPTGPPAWDRATHGAVRTAWEAVQDERDAYLAGLDDAALLRTVDYRRIDGEPNRNPLWQLLRHVVNHSTYHRGQLTMMLRQLGAATVSTDLTAYYRTLARGEHRS